MVHIRVPIIRRNAYNSERTAFHINYYNFVQSDKMYVRMLAKLVVKLITPH